MNAIMINESIDGGESPVLFERKRDFIVERFFFITFLYIFDWAVRLDSSMGQNNGVNDVMHRIF